MSDDPVAIREELRGDSWRTVRVRGTQLGLHWHLDSDGYWYAGENFFTWEQLVAFDGPLIPLAFNGPIRRVLAEIVKLRRQVASMPQVQEKGRRLGWDEAVAELRDRAATESSMLRPSSMAQAFLVASDFLNQRKTEPPKDVPQKSALSTDVDLQALAKLVEKVNGFVYQGHRLDAIVNAVIVLREDPELAAKLLGGSS